MSTPTPPEASPAPAPQQPPRPRPSQRLRPGYLASLISLAVTVMLTGTLLVVGTDAPHPEPDFIAGPAGETEFVGGPRADIDFEIEVDEDDLGAVAVFAPNGKIGMCTHYPPSGGGDSGETSSSPTAYGAQDWTLRSVHQIEEAGTHLFQCVSNEEVGIAPASTVDAAQARQFAWALLWLSMPLLFLATVTIALVTFVRSRRERAAHPTGH